MGGLWLFYPHYIKHLGNLRPEVSETSRSKLRKCVTLQCCCAQGFTRQRSAHRHKWDAVVLLVEVPNIWQPSGQVKRVPGPRSQGPSLRTSPTGPTLMLCVTRPSLMFNALPTRKKLGDIPVPAVRLGGLIFSWLSKGLGDVTPPHLSSLVSSCMFLLKRSIHVQHLWFDQMSLETLFWSAVRCTFAT